MGYTYSDGSYLSQFLVDHIQKLHGIVGNATTEGKFFVFGSGLTQLLNAAVYALPPDTSVLSLAKVLATQPLYPVYRTQSHFSMLGVLVMKEAHPHGLTRPLVNLLSLSLSIHQAILMES